MDENFSVLDSATSNSSSGSSDFDAILNTGKFFLYKKNFHTLLSFVREVVGGGKGDGVVIMMKTQMCQPTKKQSFFFFDLPHF